MRRPRRKSSCTEACKRVVEKNPKQFSVSHSYFWLCVCLLLLLLLWSWPSYLSASYFRVKLLEVPEVVSWGFIFDVHSTNFLSLLLFSSVLFCCLVFYLCFPNGFEWPTLHARRRRRIFPKPLANADSRQDCPKSSSPWRTWSKQHKRFNHELHKPRWTS